MNHSVSETGRRKTSPGLGKTLPVMSRANPTDSIKVKANALHARKRESASPQARTNAQPIKTSNGKGSRDQPTAPVNPATKATTGASAARVIALGRFFHG